MKGTIMLEVTTEEVRQLLNNVREAVDASDFGPVYIYGGTSEEPKKIVSPLGFQVYLTVLQTFLAKIDTAKLIPAEKRSALET